MKQRTGDLRRERVRGNSPQEHTLLGARGGDCVMSAGQEGAAAVPLLRPQPRSWVQGLSPTSASWGVQAHVGMGDFLRLREPESMTPILLRLVLGGTSLPGQSRVRTHKVSCRLESTLECKRLL